MTTTSGAVILSVIGLGTAGVFVCFFQLNRKRSSQRSNSNDINSAEYQHHIPSIMKQVAALKYRRLELQEPEFSSLEPETNEVAARLDCDFFSSDDPASCLVCMTRSPNTVLLECGHGGMCSTCAASLWDRDRRCPLCRQTCWSVLRILDEGPNNEVRVEALLIDLHGGAMLEAAARPDPVLGGGEDAGHNFRAAAAVAAAAAAASDSGPQASGGGDGRSPFSGVGGRESAAMVAAQVVLVSALVIAAPAAAHLSGPAAAPGAAA